jgi:hypothetical protein
MSCLALKSAAKPRRILLSRSGGARRAGSSVLAIYVKMRELRAASAGIFSRFRLWLGLVHAANVSDECQIILRAGERLKANLVLRPIFQSAQPSIDVCDPYIEVRFFALLNDKQPQVSVRILSADVKPSDRQTAADFKKEPGGLELRERRSRMHDRFVIIDRSITYVAGRSLKDVGSKDTTPTDAPDPKSVIDLFEDRWNATQS